MERVYYVMFSAFYKINLRLKPFFGTEVMLSGFMLSIYISSLLYFVSFTFGKYVFHFDVSKVELLAKAVFVALIIKTFEVAVNRDQIKARLAFLDSFSKRNVKMYYIFMLFIYLVFGLLYYFSEPREMPIRMY